MDTPASEELKVVKEAIIIHPKGLHLCFSGLLSKLASQFPDSITIINNGNTADARSPISLLALQATRGTKLSIEVEGESAKEAANAVAEFLSTYDGN
jgi:phosphocarrier protein HPr